MFKNPKHLNNYRWIINSNKKVNNENIFVRYTKAITRFLCTKNINYHRIVKLKVNTKHLIFYSFFFSSNSMKMGNNLFLSHNKNWKLCVHRRKEGRRCSKVYRYTKNWANTKRCSMLECLCVFLIFHIKHFWWHIKYIHITFYPRRTSSLNILYSSLFDSMGTLRNVLQKEKKKNGIDI